MPLSGWCMRVLLLHLGDKDTQLPITYNYGLY